MVAVGARQLKLQRVSEKRQRAHPAQLDAVLDASCKQEARGPPSPGCVNPSHPSSQYREEAGGGGQREASPHTA